jgi:hypothetical protein
LKKFFVLEKEGGCCGIIRNSIPEKESLPQTPNKEKYESFY